MSTTSVDGVTRLRFRTHTGSWFMVTEHPDGVLELWRAARADHVAYPQWELALDRLELCPAYVVEGEPAYFEGQFPWQTTSDTRVASIRTSPVQADAYWIS